MTIEWFRSWHGAPTDSKFLLIAKRAQVAPGVVSAIYWALLDYASQNTPRGSVHGFDTETYAEWAGWEEETIVAVITAMRNKGIITEDDRIAAWEKRQPKREDDGAVDRMRRMRQRNASVTRDDAVTNATVTQRDAALRDVTQRDAVLRDVTIDTDTDTDKNREMRDRPPAAAPTSPRMPADPEFGAALSKLEALGVMTGSALLEFQAIWSELRNGRRAWIDDAITVAQANGASSPVYAIRVLANSVKTGRRPGETPQPQPKRPQGRNLDELLGIKTNGK